MTQLRQREARVRWSNACANGTGYEAPVRTKRLIIFGFCCDGGVKARGWKKNRLRRKKIACPARKIACIERRIGCTVRKIACTETKIGCTARKIACTETKIGCVGGFSASDADEKSSRSTNFSCDGSFPASGEAGAASLASVHACIAANLACETASFAP